MPINGTITTTLSKVDDKGKGNMKTVMDAIANAGANPKKDGKKKKRNK